MSDKTTTSTPDSGFVTVACKLPHGLQLRLFGPQKVSEPVMGGGFRESTQYFPVGETITVFGNRVAIGDQPKCEIRNGYALTHGIPKEFWVKWLSQNETSDVVRNGFIKAHESVNYLEGFSKDNSKLQTGLEPLNIAGDPRVPKNITKAA